jgi:hypothetical protein
MMRSIIDHLKNCIGYPRLYIDFDILYQKSIYNLRSLASNDLNDH